MEITINAGIKLCRMAVLVLATIIGTCCSPDTPVLNPSIPYAPFQQNPVWRQTAELIKKKVAESPLIGDAPGGVLVRMNDNNAGELLVKFADSPGAFRYSSQSKTISPIADAEWLSGAREISCRERKFAIGGILRIDEQKKILMISKNGQQVPTAGKFALNAGESPRKDIAVILSADGPRTKARGGFIFGGSGGEILGTRHLQILDLKQATYLNEPVALQSENQSPYIHLCWVENEKFVVAYETVLNTYKFGNKFSRHRNRSIIQGIPFY